MYYRIIAEPGISYVDFPLLNIKNLDELYHLVSNEEELSFGEETIFERGGLIFIQSRDSEIGRNPTKLEIRLLSLEEQIPA